MTVLYTKGYSEVLESVKDRARKKAEALARMDVTLSPWTLLSKMEHIVRTLLTLAEDEVFPEGVSNFTEGEEESLWLATSSELLKTYGETRREIAGEKLMAEETALIEKAGVCVETTRMP